MQSFDTSPTGYKQKPEDVINAGFLSINVCLLQKTFPQNLTEISAYLYPTHHTIYLCYLKICVCFLGPNYYRRFCLNGPNNREINQSVLSASGHGFERLNSRI